MKKVIKDILLKSMFKYSEHAWAPLNELHNDLPFENWKLKVKKLVANLYDKSEYLIHIRNLKQALSHRLFLKNVQRVIKFNQNVW